MQKQQQGQGITKNKNIDKVLNIFQFLGVQNQMPQVGNLYLGSVHALLKKEHIRQRKITSVLTLLIRKRYESQNVKGKLLDILFDKNSQQAQEFKQREFNVDQQLNKVHLHIEISDHNYQNLEQHFDKTYQFIKGQLIRHAFDKQAKPGNVFVHCMCGISRSSSTIIAFLMKLHSEKSFIIKQLQKSNKKMNFKIHKDESKSIPTFQQLKQIVKQKRPIIMPNQGFSKQLVKYRQKLISKSLKQ